MMMQPLPRRWAIAGLLVCLAVACVTTVQVARGEWRVVSLLDCLFSVCIVASQVYRRAALALWTLAFLFLAAALWTAGHAFG